MKCIRSTIIPSIVALLVMLASRGKLLARIVAFESFECDDPSANSYAVGIQDDVTHESYTMYVKCDGSVCIYPLYGPFQGIVSTRGWLAPIDQRSRFDAAQSIAAPGDPVGELWLRGDTLSLYDRSGLRTNESTARALRS